jgi:5-methylcytosine-specific restriction endonuclease McrA
MSKATPRECRKCGTEYAKRCLACASAYSKQWRKKNPEKAKEYKSIYSKRARAFNNEKYNEKRRRNRSSTANKSAYLKRKEWLLSGDVTNEQLRMLFALQDQCFYCNETVKPRFNAKDPRGFDHIVPRAKGGKHTISNLVVCCALCNGKKSDKDLLHRARGVK